MPIYYLLGYFYSIINVALIALCILLLSKDIAEEKSKRVVFLPSILFAILAGVIAYAYAMEIFIAYYSGGKYELEAFKLRMTGPYAWVYFTYLLGTTLPILLFFPYFRKTTLHILIIAIIAFTLRASESFLIITII